MIPYKFNDAKSASAFTRLVRKTYKRMAEVDTNDPTQVMVSQWMSSFSKGLHDHNAHFYNLTDNQLNDLQRQLLKTARTFGGREYW